MKAKWKIPTLPKIKKTRLIKPMLMLSLTKQVQYLTSAK